MAGPDRSQPAHTAVGRTFLRLGLISFGGPVAHIGYFRAEVVGRLRWLTDAQYADLVALSQFLPGPASSQVGMGVGLLRAGIPGALRAWLGFTAPSAVLMLAAGLAVGSGAVRLPAGALSGLKVAAAAVVALAVVQMARALCRGWLRALVAVAAGMVALAVATPWAAPGALLVAGLVGMLVLRDAGPGPESDGAELVPRLPRHAGSVALVLFVALLVLLPAVARAWPGTGTALVAGCYRAGALVFGGGHVVLPLLEDVSVGSGAVTADEFLAGYGLANAMPGPLFTVAAYLGAAAGGVLLGVLCLVAVFLPGSLLIVATLGHWHRVRGIPALRRALAAVSAAVVGLLGAALYDPVLTSAITGWREAVLGLAAFVALAGLRLPAHLVVLACAVSGWLLLG